MTMKTRYVFTAAAFAARVFFSVLSQIILAEENIAEGNRVPIPGSTMRIRVSDVDIVLKQNLKGKAVACRPDPAIATSDAAKTSRRTATVADAAGAETMDSSAPDADPLVRIR